MHNDPDQQEELKKEEVQAVMRRYIAEYMQKNDAPPELYDRLGIEPVSGEAEKG